MRVLVTGGAGYIGSHTVDLLIQRGHEVVVFDNLSTGHSKALHPKAELIRGDLLNLADVLTAFQGAPYDGIIHFASHIMVGESVVKPWLYLRDNYLAATNILEAATKNGVKRFILSSTAAIFGEHAISPIPPDAPPGPTNPYGESKYMIERLLRWMYELHGMAYCCLRYFNASGAHPEGHLGEDHHPETHLIPLTIQAALGQRDSLTIFGDDYNTPDGTAVRDYVHVIDLADAHLLALEKLADGKPHAYNLGTNRGYSVREVIDTVEKVSGRRINAVVGPRRAGDATELVADSTKAQQELGWYPEFSSLPQIVETAWRWHSTNPDGYQDK